MSGHSHWGHEAESGYGYEGHPGQHHDPLDGLLDGMLGGRPDGNFLKRILHGEDRQFLMGALVGAGAVLVLTNPAVKEALFGLFKGGGAVKPQGSAPQEKPAPEPKAAKPRTHRPRKASAAGKPAKSTQPKAGA